MYALRTQLTWTHLRSLMAIDDPLKRQFYLNKLGKFKPEYEGQMKLYLRYLNNNERKPWEEAPMGLILCSEGNTEHIEYLMLDESAKDIRVAQYFAGLPSKAVLRRKLQRAVVLAQESVHERIVESPTKRRKRK